MNGLIIKCNVLYFATFRKPTSTSLILTYSIPPFTTIRGMIANAMGLSRDDYSLQEKIKIGIKILKVGNKNVEMAKILKLKESPMPRSRMYPSSPMFREFIVQPEYEFFIAGEENIMDDVYASLCNPVRSLYLGQSDDLIDIEFSEPLEIFEEETEYFDSVVEGIFPGCTIDKVPYSFSEENGKYSVDYRIISLNKPESSIKAKGKAYLFNNRKIALY